MGRLHSRRNVANRTIKQCKESHWRTFCQGLDANTKIGTIWDKIGRIKGNKRTRTAIPKLTKPHIANTDIEKAEALAQQYYQVSATETLGQEEIKRRKDMKVEEEEQAEQPEELDINAPITEQETINAIKSKTISTSGHDIVSYQLL